jgi:hypothetical protein
MYWYFWERDVRVATNSVLAMGIVCKVPSVPSVWLASCLGFRDSTTQMWKDRSSTSLPVELSAMTHMAV